MPAVKSPCIQCKEKHVKCDEQRPKCNRCINKNLPCERPSKKTIFRHGARARFAKDQEWVNSSAKQFRVQTGQQVLTMGSPLSWSPDSKTADSPETSVTSPRDDSRRPSIPHISYIKDSKPGLGNTLPPIEDSEYRQFPLHNVQEACLLRYFVEEISQWFDLCDEYRHFQLVVPVRARHHPHLLNAIFAVAARHLSRLPQYKTPQGIMYHGQLLPNLTQDDAVEYMLKCIPAFRRFHQAQDDDFRDSIIATAVILRQLEEIDDEDENDSNGNTGELNKQVNFLPIINAVLQNPASQALFRHRSLIQAAYWMALRQEIYHSFTRREPPQLNLAPEFWQSASKVNKTVMHTVQAAKWHWGGGTDDEWLRLMDQQVHLEQHVLAEHQPIFQRAADKAKGEIFPTLWYGSNVELTSIQQAIMARSILTAENPFLKKQAGSRSDWRKVENDVRMLMLDLCGIALCHPASAPALVNAAMGIQVYGDFFTDHYERLALKTVVEKYRDAHAWPVKQLLEMFK